MANTHFGEDLTPVSAGEQRDADALAAEGGVGFSESRVEMWERQLKQREARLAARRKADEEAATVGCTFAPATTRASKRPPGWEGVPVAERTGAWQQHRDARRDAAARDRGRRELAGCTFHPAGLRPGPYIAALEAASVYEADGVEEFLARKALAREQEAARAPLEFGDGWTPVITIPKDFRFSSKAAAGTPRNSTRAGRSGGSGSLPSTPRIRRWTDDSSTTLSADPSAAYDALLRSFERLMGPPPAPNGPPTPTHPDMDPDPCPDPDPDAVPATLMAAYAADP
jgi:hypothetical protein